MFELAFILLLLGIVVFSAGVVGRRTGDEPRCKACGYDLSGLVRPGQAPTGRDAPGIMCPECGVDLKLTTTAPGDIGSPIRIGRRKRGRSAIMLGVVLLLPAVGVLGYAGVMIVAGPGWSHRKPVTLLMYEAKHLRGHRADGAITELYKRLIENTTTPAQERAIIDAALEIQARPDPSLWFGTRYGVLISWGTLFDIAARQNGSATPEQARKYVQNSLAIRFEHRSRVRPGDDWPLGVVIDRARVAGFQRPMIRPVLEELTIGSWTLDLSTVVVTGASRVPGGGASERFVAAVAPLVDIPLGRHEVRQRWTINAHDPAAGGVGPGPLIDSWIVEITSTVIVHPRGYETVEVFTDASLAATIAPVISHGETWFHDDGQEVWLHSRVSLDEVTANVAWRVVAVGESGEVLLGTMVAREGQSAMTYLLKAVWPSSHGRPLRIEFHPSTDVARTTPDIERILDIRVTHDLGEAPLQVHGDRP